MRTIVILAALGLGACTTTPAMQRALAPLAGQSVGVVLARLGPPTSFTRSGAETVYEWHHGKRVPGAPSAGSLVAPVAPGENTVTSGVFSGTAVSYSCDVRIVADGEGRIKDAQFSEQTGGCRDTARELNRLALADPR